MNPHQAEKDNGAVSDVNVTASSTTCNSCSDCTNKLNGKYDTVKLTRDLINVKGSCITFGANNVVFSGNGHKIDGDDTGEFESGITMSSKSGNTIKNCDITDFESGITLYGSSKNKIYDNEVSSNYYDGIWISTNSNSNNIHDNLIEDNGNYGVYFSSESNNNIFSKNVVCSNPTDIRDYDKNSGDDNTCDTAHNWNDDGTNGCTYSCPAEKPDLIITEIICDRANDRIGYKIKNIGDATAPKGHYTTLFVDGAFKIKEQVDVNLAPGASSQRYFDYYSWQCSPPQDNVKVCADYGDFVDESNEKNNCREETCQCAPPEKPDLIITDVWNEDSTICYQVRNIGNATAPKGHYTALSIDGEPVVNDLVDVELAPKERLKQCFNYGWQCSPPDDTITVCVDHKDIVDEASEENNCRNETWKCDNTPPVIVSGPVVSGVTPSSVTISWTTNEDSDSMVEFGRTAGKYEDQKFSLKMKQEHKVILTDLLPSTTYRYVVESTDASENTVVSQDGFFETGPVPDDEPPVVHALNITRGKGNFLYYEMSADVSDNIGVERVEFYMVDVLIGTDYNEPYQCYIVADDMEIDGMEISREAFFREHTVETIVVDLGGMILESPVRWGPPYEVMNVQAEILTPCCSHPRPYPGYLYTDGGAVPDGTTVDITVRAVEFEWGEEILGTPEYSGGMPPSMREHIPHPVQRVGFYLDGTRIGTSTTPSSTDENYIYTHTWDASGLVAGDYEIEVRAVATDGTVENATCTVTVAEGMPTVMLARSVSRIDNYFEVTLTLSNPGDASARVDTITDHVVGFQAVGKSAEEYSVTTDYTTATKDCEILIDLFTDTTDTITLSPDDDPIRVKYSVVPILYKDATDYSIGEAETVTRYYDPSGRLEENRITSPCVGDECFPSSVDNAIETSDYLIVTNPSRLFIFNIDAEVNILLSEMAHLAYLKQGVLGYLETTTDLTTGNLIEPGGGWASQLHSIFSNTLGGYLLIVGEMEIVSSWHLHGFDIHWSDGGVTDDVHFTDHPYADTTDDGAPDLIVGRIVGDSATALTTPIQVSIGVHEGSAGFGFDRSDALLVSGTGGGESDMVNAINRAADTIDGEFAVDVLHWRDYATASQRLREFRNRAPNKDVICYDGHGGVDSWSAVGNSNFPVNFGSVNPFAFALACSAGNYERGDDNNIAEAFFDSGTAVYIGSTENSPGTQNDDAANRFFDNHWDSDVSIGYAFTEMERDRWSHGDGWQFWVYEYNLYGDPKFGAVSPPGDRGASMLAGLQTPLSSLRVEVPDYEVTARQKLDYVEIPGGDLLLEEGEYRILYYTVSINYPRGYKVQDVFLTNRSRLVTDTDLNIPITTIACRMSNDESPSGNGGGWVPEETYRWQIIQNPDGSTTLLIMMYPFYYNHLTTDVEFYRNYTFEISYTTSTVEIAALRTDKDAYQQGDDILIDLWLNNSGDTQDVLVDAVVKAGGSGEVAFGLLLRTLKEFAGHASFSPHWDSSGIVPGYYIVEVTLKDTGGNVLDRKTEMFRLGISSGEITNFTATPEYFDIGDDIDINMAFNNNGTVNITGVAVTRILNLTGDVVEEFRHNVTDLMPSESIGFDDTWDTSGAEEGSYKILGYVLYDSKATSPATVIVTSVPIEKKPDLEIVKKWESWVDKEKGTYTVTYVVHNNGTTVAPAGHHTTLYIDEEAVEHKPVPVTLKPCDKYEDTFKTVVKCTPPGDKITVCVDNYDKVEELDEGNNCMTNVWHCPVPAKKPDLVIKDIKLTKMEGYCYVDYLISNTGTVSAAASTTYLYVDGKKVASDSTGALATGASRWDRFTYRATGTHTYKVCADGPNAISESNEANNCRTEKLTCPLSRDIYFADGGESPGSVYHYNTTTGIEETVYTRPSRRLHSFSFHPAIPEKLYYVNANENKIYRTLQLPSGWTPEEVVYTHTTYVSDIAFAFDKDGELRLYFSEATGGGGNGKIYKIEDGKASLYYEVKLADVGGSWGGDFAFDDKGNLYLSSGNQIPASIYKVEEGKVKEIFKDEKEPISGLVYADGALYYANWGTKIYRLDLSTKERTVVYSNTKRTWLSDVDFRPGGIG
uniref:Fibronectin type-III domain-containing protein n=1 Tax=Candidatus Methanophagaceae archaeon ANME-1 ERB6 TaxID=2759912 RepID=A0A7G9YST4_9EURY|nr:hypothetical protein HCFNICHJ_00025 [Methanosarcinales archaeon ANME-1 ERB6]